MNATTRHDLDSIPIPVDEYGPIRCMAIGRNGQWRTAWGMSGGRKPEPFGEPYASAKDAARASRYINERGGP